MYLEVSQVFEAGYSQKIRIGGRSFAINRMFQMGCSFRFKIRTVFLAYHLYDLWDNKIPELSFEINRLRIICCMIVAAKFEEILVPSPSTLLRNLSKDYNTLYKALELELL